MKDFAPYFWVGLGGFVGANARYLVNRLCTELLGFRFPWGTFVVNITGSFMLGFVTALVAQKLVPHSDELRLAVGIGFIGAYTTFSTFEYETNALLQHGSFWLMGLNVVGSVVVGLIAVRLGMATARF